ncbi:hypothetical protein HOG48_04400 [Candidatus Peregrinibacteria bacterium]|jgi:hypothetical protein|nr:hypothetical protein [Candidatus Peregrinibacteria bacterium]
MKKLIFTISLILILLSTTVGQIAFAAPEDMFEGTPMDEETSSGPPGIPSGSGGPHGPTDHAADSEIPDTSETAGKSVDTGDYNADCFGYPGGDSADASDFALKIDCILNTDHTDGETTDEQSMAYFIDNGQSPAVNLLTKIANTMIKIVGSIAMLLIVVAGIMIITSPGNDTQRSNAIQIIQACIIGLVVAFSSYIIVNFVQGLFY